MITKWKVFNFKSIRKETELDIAPLTVFAGANSSGKSTFLQSILLVAQTLSHKVSSRSVVLNGLYTRLGQFDDFRSVGTDADQITIGWTCQPQQVPASRWDRSTSVRRLSMFTHPGHLLTSVSCEVAFDAESSGEPREVTQIQPRLFSTRVSSVSHMREGTDRHSHISIRRRDGVDEISGRRWLDAVRPEDRLTRESLRYEAELDTESMDEIREEFPSAQIVGCTLRHFLPERPSFGLDIDEESAQMILAALRGDGSRMYARRIVSEQDPMVPTEVTRYICGLAQRSGATDLATRLQSSALTLVALLEVLRSTPRFAVDLRRELAESEDFERCVHAAVRTAEGQRLGVVSYRAPGAIAEACYYLEQFFATSVRYLGPLRDEPKSLYPLAPTADPLDVGLKGEDTAAVLELHKSQTVRYISPSDFSDDDVKPRPVVRTLEVAVVEWLRYLGIAENVQTRDRGKFGHELMVNMPGGSRAHDLTHVGVGVSQVLPILVACLLAEPDTTLIFEQPEIHLHPKVQTLLADFFLSMTQLGKQCVIETHSEYLINRIRFRTAAAMKSNPWVNVTKVYFVENQEGSSVFREVRINEYGAIQDWPEGFFDESQREAEAILRAATLKRRANRGGS